MIPAAARRLSAIPPLVVLVLLLAAPSALLGQPLEPVRVQTGLLTGVATEVPGVRVFRGIPFAAPPVGPLRWRAPAPPAAWSGIRAAEEFGPGCIQRVAGSRPPWTEEFMHQGEVSEDCLSLNVWTAARAAEERRPVLVYVHGGGFNEGSGSIAAYDGAALAAKGSVVVTLNYRMGVLGFLAHPELSREAGTGSGNYGLLDQLAALHWIHENIAAFGGDPANVTLAGQSAGAISVHALVASPLAAGLIHRAIAQSGPGALASMGMGGTGGVAAPLADAEQAGAAYAAAVGASTLQDLREMPVERLTAPPPGTPARFRPVVDGRLLPADLPALHAAGRQNDVPMIIGMNADEGSASQDYAHTSVAAYREWVEGAFEERAAAVLRANPATDDAAATRARQRLLREVALAGLAQVARERESGEAATFVYLLERGIPWPERPEFGAFHTSEVPYVFDNLEVLDRPWEEVDRRIASTLSGYWTRFAETGDPNHAGAPFWRPFDAAAPSVLVLGDEIGTKEMPAAPGAEPR